MDAGLVSRLVAAHLLGTARRIAADRLGDPLHLSGVERRHAPRRVRRGERRCDLVAACAAPPESAGNLRECLVPRAFGNRRAVAAQCELPFLRDYL